MSTCPDEAQLAALTEGRLQIHDADALQAHLQSCSACREAVEDRRDGSGLTADLRHASEEDTASEPTLSELPASASALIGQMQPASPAHEEIPDYQILREIHRGGQGIVYEANQLSTKRKVAVKVLLHGAWAGEHARWRFEREVHLAAGLKHPNIVAIHDSGITHGRYYFAMDCIAGQPLDGYVQSCRLAPREIVRLFRKVCDAVSHAHQKGVIHRDLKPSNILVDDGGTPYVLDFGLAKAFGDSAEEEASVDISMPGRLMGTLRYMSPEQTRSQPVDLRSDIYTLGVILYELLTGRPPYKAGEGADLNTAIMNIQNTDPPRPARIRGEVDSDLNAIVLRAMAKEPHRRYGSASEMLYDLDAWLDNRPVTARSDSSLYVLRKLAFRHGFETSLIFTMVAALIGFGGVSYHLFRNEQDRASRLAGIVAANNARDAQQADVASRSQADVRRQRLGWFLLEWKESRPERARAIADTVPAGSPEREVMAFLLDEHYPVDRLQKAVGPSEARLARFAAGERALRAGRPKEALAAFELAAPLPGGGDWLLEAVQARLEHLHAAATQPTGGAAPEGTVPGEAP